MHIYDTGSLIDGDGNPIEISILILHESGRNFVDVLYEFLVSLALLVLFQFLRNFEQPIIKIVKDRQIITIVLFLFNFAFERILIKLFLALELHFAYERRIQFVSKILH